MMYCFLSAGLSLLLPFGLFAGVTQSCYDVVIVGGDLWSKFRTALETHYCGANTLKIGWESSAVLEPSVDRNAMKNKVLALAMLPK